MIAKRPPLDLTFADDAEAQAYAQANGGMSLASSHVRLESSSVTALPGFGQGRWWVQDLAASLPARLIPSEAEAALDLCAAPGGKTMQLAAAGHRVTAVDASATRLDRLRENLARTQLRAELVAADALMWCPDRQFDAILLDAPCSATGTFRRHPEVLYRAQPKLISDGAELQGKLLDRAAQWLNPRGVLVYSVCSLEAEEGEDVIRAFLARHADYRLDVPVDLPAAIQISGGAWVRTLPGLLEAEGGLDGFFNARLVRTR
jgi:16S rRNA (cytosine967-C5)-methyltransferase